MINKGFKPCKLMVSILAGSFNMIISDLAETAVARYSTNSAIVQFKSCLI